MSKDKQKRGMKTRNIILAEDDEDDVNIFIDALSEYRIQMELIVATNGKVLTDLLDRAQTSPTIIFLDLNMPFKNGFECLKEIRGNEKFKDIKIVILSTASHPTVIDLAYQKGADHFLVKADNFSKHKENLHRCLDLYCGTDNVEISADAEKRTQ